MAQTKVQLLQPNLGDVIDFDSSTLFMDGADNRVGIRNTNPQYELDVTGTVNATNFRGNISVGTIDDWITHTGDTDTKIGFSAADQFQIQTGGSARIQCDADGVKAYNGRFYSAGTFAYIESSSTSHTTLTLRKTASGADAIDYLQLRDNSNALKLKIGGDGIIYTPDVVASHEGDTDTKIRFSGADTISFETGGSPRAFINSAGDLTIGSAAGTLGKVYIRQAADTDTEGLSLLNSGGSNSFRLFLGDSSGGVAHLGHGGLKQFNITQAGKVGINQAAPEALLHIEASSSGASYTADAADTLILERNGGCVIDFRTPAANDGGLIFSDNSARAQGTLLYQHSDNSLRFGTAGGERARIDSAGRIFINRTAQHASSSERLSVNGMTSIQYNSTSTAGLYIFNEETTTSGDPVQPFIFFHDGGGIRGGLGVQRSTGKTILNGQFGISFRTGSSGVGGTEKVYIKTDGNVGINNSSPAEKLDVTGSVQASGGFKTAGHPVVTYASFSDISGGSYATRLGSTGTSTLRSTQIYGGGVHLATFDGVNKRLGINITAPLWDIHAQKSSGTTVIGCKNTSGNATVYIEASNTNTAKLELCEAATGSYSLQVGNDNALMFFDDSDERMRIDSAGDIAINTNDGDFGQSNGASQFAKGDPKLGVHGSIGIMNTSSTTTDFSQLAFYRRTAATPQGNGSHRITSTHNLGKISWFGSSNDTSFPDEVVFITSIANGGDWWSGSNRRASLQFHNNNVGEMVRYSSNGAHAGRAIMNRDCNGVSGGAWTTHGAWKVLIDLSGYPTDQLYMCDAAMQHLSAYTATFWVYKCNNSHYDIIHEESSLCDFRLNGSQIEIKQSSGVDQTNTTGYQKIFAVAGMYKPLT